MNEDYYLQISYSKILGSQLERFRVKKESPFLAVAACPICGEGSSKTKTRFFLYEKDHSVNCMCHNCNLSTTLPKFLKLHFKHIFDDFIFDKYKHKTTEPIIKKILHAPKPVVKSNNRLQLELVSDLPDNHFAKEYITSRKLPEYPFYFVPNFYQYSSQFNNEFKHIKKDEARIIIPFFDRNGNIFAYQGRDLSGHAKQKYITVKIKTETPLLFGYEKLNISKEILLVEGPLDSLFLPNAVASVNASLSATAKWLLNGINKSPDSIVLILDNEPRNRAVVAEYEKAIEAGFKTVIWPKNIIEKDINAMTLSGLDPLSILKKNTYQGLLAKLNFNKWKQV